MRTKSDELQEFWTHLNCPTKVILIIAQMSQESS